MPPVLLGTQSFTRINEAGAAISVNPYLLVPSQADMSRCLKNT